MHNQPVQPLDDLEALREENERLRKERDAIRLALLALVRADQISTSRNTFSYRLTLEEAKYILETTV